MIPYAHERISGNIERNPDLELYYCGTQDCTPAHAFGPGLKDHFKLHFVHSGKGTYTTGGLTHTIGPGQVFLIFPDTVVRYEADRSEPWKYSWAAFDGLKARSCMTRAGFDESRLVRSCTDPDLVERELLALVAASADGKDREMRLIGILYIFMSTLIDDASKAERNMHDRMPRVDGGMNDHVMKAVRFIEKNYSHEVSVKDIAGYACLERKYFSSLFKSQTGLSPKAFLTEIRFRRASSLLANTRISIGEISRSVGFADPLLFSKSFRLHMGMSPSEFRNGF